MLHDVDQTLENFLRGRCGISNDIEVSFDAPTRDWSSRRNTPTINFFLYDLRESLDRRQAALEETRDARGLVESIALATRWFNCSYLITAWTQRAEDEHRLLSQVLLGFLQVHALPIEDLVGALTEKERNIPLTIGRPPTQDRSISDIWSALGGELKPSLDLVLLVPFEPTGSQVFGPPVMEAPSFSINGGPSERMAGHRRAVPGREVPTTRPLREIAAEEKADSFEELNAGTPEQPGRRFRFSVHEPQKAQRRRGAARDDRRTQPATEEGSAETTTKGPTKK
jgi:Pvc16 N-terminal domain